MDNKRRPKFLNRIKKRTSNSGKGEGDEDTGDEENVTGNNAPVFGTETLGSGFGRPQPRYIKVIILFEIYLKG